jgi:hypothetical protein
MARSTFASITKEVSLCLSASSLKREYNSNVSDRVSKERVANCTSFQIERKGQKSRSIVAQFTGISERQLSKEKLIVKVAYTYHINGF